MKRPKLNFSSNELAAIVAGGIAASGVPVVTNSAFDALEARQQKEKLSAQMNPSNDVAHERMKADSAIIRAGYEGMTGLGVATAGAGALIGGSSYVEALERKKKRKKDGAEPKAAMR